MGLVPGVGGVHSMSGHFLYVVECADGTLYTGYATDVARRVETHNAGKGAKYTRSRRPVLLVYSREFESKHDAMNAEYRFKRLSRAQKLAVIAGEGEGYFDEELR